MSKTDHTSFIKIYPAIQAGVARKGTYKHTYSQFQLAVSLTVVKSHVGRFGALQYGGFIFFFIGRYVVIGTQAFDQ